MEILRRVALWYYARSVRRLLAGDICSIRSEDHFSVAKILDIGREVVHVRLYKEKFRDRPTSVQSLSLGHIDDPDGFGVGHLPLSLGTFGSWLPVCFQQEPVTDDELIWVREWEKSGGSVWG
jgi:hypothetical protein